MKKYIKYTITLLIITIILSTTVINTVNAISILDKVELPDNLDHQKIQISLIDGCVPDSTLVLDVNCDGIITNRDADLMACDIAGYQTNITEQGMENVSNYINGYALAEAMQCALGKVRIVGCNEFEVGANITLKAYAQNATASDTENLFSQIGSENLSNVLWESSDENIAEVDINGNVNFKADGEVFITATSEDGYCDKIKFYVGNVQEIAQLTGSPIIKGSKLTKVNLKVDLSSIEETMAGFKITLRQRISTEANEQLLGKATQIKSKTEGWAVTEINIDEESVNSEIKYIFVVEPNDEYFEENNFGNIPELLDIEFTFPVDSDSNIGGNCFYVFDFCGTDINGTVYDMLPQGYGLVLNKKLTDPVLTVKEEVDTNKIKITGNDILVKLNDETFEDLYNNLDNNLENFNCYWVDDYQNCLLGDKNGVSTGYLYVAGNDTSAYKYNLYVMGDICVDSSHCININDVVYLRKAIVGLFDNEQPNDFCIETTDVNNSNIAEDGTRQIGDIGDVIEIRKRIINNKWL